ncbi:hypothetical protein D6C95_00656, partial [Aureobasidium pullulans]
DLPRKKKNKWNQFPESSNRTERSALYALDDRVQISEDKTNAEMVRKIFEIQMIATGTLPIKERRDVVSGAVVRNSSSFLFEASLDCKDTAELVYERRMSRRLDWDLLASGANISFINLALGSSVDPGQAHGERVAAVGSALRFDEACNLHRGVAAESLLGRVLDGCRSARLAASKVTI